MDEYQQANRALWDEWTGIHARSAFYDLAGFKAGQSTLRPIELAELGDGTGRSLLHLQCHFGLDTLSWARRGAVVTGADFSEPAIALARSLSAELGIPATFVCSDVYDLPNVLAGAFDVVFTSYGVLCWLPDLRRWAGVIAHFLQPGGTFYLVEGHPLANVFEEDEDAPGLRIAYPYFGSPEPTLWKVEGSYAERHAQVSQPVSYEWTHTLGDVVNALVGAGLRLEFLHEFPFSAYPQFPAMEQGEDGWWRLPGGRETLPLLFSLKATKDIPGG